MNDFRKRDGSASVAKWALDVEFGDYKQIQKFTQLFYGRHWHVMPEIVIGEQNGTFHVHIEYDWIVNLIEIAEILKKCDFSFEDDDG